MRMLRTIKLSSEVLDPAACVIFFDTAPDGSSEKKDNNNNDNNIYFYHARKRSSTFIYLFYLHFQRKISNINARSRARTPGLTYFVPDSHKHHSIKCKPI